LESLPTTPARLRDSPLTPARIGLPPPLSAAEIDAIAVPALDEDRLGPDRRGHGDITSDNVVPETARARGRLVSKSSGRLAGLDVFARVIALCDPAARIELAARDGDSIAPKQVLLRVEGRGRGLLAAERTGLNLIQRMSGIATVTARYVERVGGKARVLDTRKTTPGLRVLEKYAVRCGGGENHRFGLYDEAMVKNNHLDLAGRGLAAALVDLRRAVGPAVRITAEARDEAEALAGVEGGADVVMLDNFTVERMKAVCPRLRAAAATRGRALEIEASGGITLDNIAAVAESGVERISIGALTHSAPALDLSFYLEPAT
jgi:nicotinate-nucleotide pyrophosphorylase (carboxylating)